MTGKEILSHGHARSRNLKIAIQKFDQVLSCSRNSHVKLHQNEANKVSKTICNKLFRTRGGAKQLTIMTEQQIVRIALPSEIY